MSFDANTFFEQFHEDFVDEERDDDADLDEDDALPVRAFVLGDRRLTLQDNFDEIREVLTQAGVMSGDFTSLEYNLDDVAEDVYSFNGGDGNEWTVVLKFTNPKEPSSFFFLTFDGYYSSWDQSELNTAYVSEPYTFTETRYKMIEKL